MLSSIPGLQSLDIRSTLLQLVTIKNVSRWYQMSPPHLRGGTELALGILNYEQHHLIRANGAVF